MTFNQAVKKYGSDKAYQMFGLTDHAVITKHHNMVTLRCGDYFASHPTTHVDVTEREAISRLKKNLSEMDITFEEIYA